MTFKKVVVVGGGVLGSQIAFQTAYCGFDVTILLRSDASIERAKVKIDGLKEIYLSSMEKMKTNKTAYCRGFTSETNLTDNQIDELKMCVEKAYTNIIMTTNYEEACNNADLVIESIAEIPKEKEEIYTNLAKYLPEKTIIVTNSSTLLPSQLADSTGRPEKYLAFHFANEIWKFNTVEIMMHSKSNSEYFDILINFAKLINMIPLPVLKEQKGYILNSLLVPFLDSALYLWGNDVALPETIDKTWRLATGSPVGPFQLMDVVGLTTVINIKSMILKSNDPNSIDVKIIKKLKAMADEGKLGKTSGEGFYKY
ncbi:hypothetical protein PIROE2DRAFT_15848 [Piromyces sp. E2]|nr:hypothetical protein PIROE2DRAFT_15848 [Piromyces sp. E2]|eukprot:OUM58796.1 hypothetical protein PIROE2DRAFT_15848 [Piromyces sp. E2]